MKDFQSALAELDSLSHWLCHGPATLLVGVVTVKSLMAMALPVPTCLENQGTPEVYNTLIGRLTVHTYPMSDSGHLGSREGCHSLLQGAVPTNGIKSRPQTTCSVYMNNKGSR